MSVAVVIQYAKHMHRIALLYVACLALNDVFPHYLINGTVFREKLLNTKCVFWFSVQLLSKTFLILRRIRLDIFINVRRSSCKVMLSDFNATWISRPIFEKFSDTEFHLSPMEVEFWADGRTVMTKVVVSFRNFAIAPKGNLRYTSYVT
jgi:hypothetical protein